MSNTMDAVSSYSRVSQCLVKSRYMGSWEKRAVKVDLNDKKLLITSDGGKTKQFPLQEVSFRKDSGGTVLVRVSKKRAYEIRQDDDVNSRLSEISMFHDSQLFDDKVCEMTVPAPKKLNYFAPLRSLSYEEGFVPIRSSVVDMGKRSLESYKRRPSYIVETDWRRDPKKGGVVFINEEKKSNISKIVGYICKKVISTGSFMGVSFPTFAMKPESILETYCKCMGAVPLIFDKVGSDPVDRIKAFNAAILTLSIQFNDVDKPFNPAIGETFQGEIGGYMVYAEQISHHPPVSSFMLDGKNFVLHGSLELNAKIGLNSAVGMFYGDVVVQFDDGGVVRGRMPCGVMSNIMFGETRFGPDGAVYSYDPLNQIYCSYGLQRQDVLVGYIGKLREKSLKKFNFLLEDKGHNRYENFKSFVEKDFDKILCKMEAKWSEGVKYDGHEYISYLKSEWKPIILTQNISGESLLQSDSRKRLDIQLRQEGKMEDSQEQKQRIEQEQRRLRKLRDLHRKQK